MLPSRLSIFILFVSNALCSSQQHVDQHSLPNLARLRFVTEAHTSRKVSALTQNIGVFAPSFFSTPSWNCFVLESETTPTISRRLCLRIDYTSSVAFQYSLALKNWFALSQKCQAASERLSRDGVNQPQVGQEHRKRQQRCRLRRGHLFGHLCR